MVEPHVSSDAAVALAAAAATARTVVGYSLEGAASALGVSTALLSDVEGTTAPLSDAMRRNMEATYGITLDRLIAQMPGHSMRTSLSYDAEAGILRIGELGVRFRAGVQSNDELLRGFSAAVRRQRQIPPSVPLHLRSTDMHVLAELLDLDDSQLDERAQFWLGQTPETRQSFSTSLRLSRSVDSTNLAAA